MTRLLGFLLLLSVLPVTGASAQFSWKAMEIPVRDGARLAADLHAVDTARRKPVVLVQTPYNKNLYRLATPLPPASVAGLPLDTAFHYVILDWRGFYGSREAGEPGYDRGLDGYDAVEWIAEQSWCDGRIGTWGGSALGAIQFQTARHKPPHLVCAVPMVKDFRTNYTDSYYGGEFRQSHVESLEALGFFPVSLVLQHPARDVYWRFLEATTDYPEEFSVPMLMIGGWFDHFPDQVLRAFEDIRVRSAAAVRPDHRLIFGPWTHSGLGTLRQGELEYPVAEGVAREEAIRFLRYHLLGEENGWESTPMVRYYQLGEDEWRTAQSWSDVVAAADTLSLYLRDDRTLGFEPDESESVHPFTFDPNDPSPTHGGSYFDPFDPDAPVGPHDQRAVVESRSDALIFTTPALERDVEVNGPIAVELFVASDRFDTDVAVRLTDVHPDGRSMLLTQGIRRMRFRNGFMPEDTSLAEPDSIYRVVVELQNLAVTFKRGHAIRIIVTGSNWPHFGLNPNTPAPLYGSPDSVVAHTSLTTGGSSPARIILPVRSGTSGVRRDEGRGLQNLQIVPTERGNALRLFMTEPDHVVVDVFDVLGRRVVAVTDRYLDRGEHVIPIMAPHGGLFFCRLTGSSGRATIAVPFVDTRFTGQ